ncbi:hypothetical protein EPI10_005391 [Gossypium australe]|uniref:Uncharacterized protein n=1 Tax=Gossypium australe TaxID=47621 RepID=A0A5B6WMW9_9ROSI|nr:hypothetical protein EPI10_005391 [Gossypium australe]
MRGVPIENCTAFKKLVERFIKMGIVKFDGPSDAKNPLPNHTNKGVNAIVENTGQKTKMYITEVKTPLREVWKKMVENGLITQDSRNRSREVRNYYEFHYKKDHEIQKCSEFRTLVQGLMDNKKLKFFEYTEEEEVCSSEGGSIEKVYGANCPVVIIIRPRINKAGSKTAPKVVIQKPGTLELWLQCDNPRRDNPGQHTRERSNCGFLYGSEKCYDTPNTKAELVKGKSLAIEQKKEKSELPINEPIAEKEAKEFLKFLKQSEYSVVEQLHKQPACISVLALLLSSEAHRNELIKVLNETYVANDISVNKLDCLVNNISSDSYIFFNDDEIPPGGIESTKALHITTSCKGYTLPGVLIDNRSALNVLPLSTLNRLPMDSSHMKTCQNIVRAFDGTERKVMERIDVPLLIGLNIYEIYSAGAVPSSLHQKLKLITDGRLITINAKEDIIASVTSDAPYIEANGEAIECSFRSLKFVNAIFIVEGSKISMPKISKATRMSLQLTVGNGALPGKGLGKYLHGRVEVSILTDKRDRFGLGYKPDAKQRNKEFEKKQERRRA